MASADSPRGARAASPNSQALGESGISVEPATGVTSSPWLVYEVDPGGSISDDAIVANDSETARSLDVYAADARTLPSGAFEADLQQVRPSQLGAWTRLDVSHIDLPPHTSRHVHLVLQVPQGADVGEYEGSILAQFETADNQQVRIVHRVGLRVYMTVKGAAAESGRIDSISSGHWWERGWPSDPVQLRTTFANTSKVHLKLSGAAKAGGPDIPLGEAGGETVVLRNSQATLVTPIRSHPWIGMQRVQVDVVYANRGSGHAVATTDVWFIPWKALLLVLALVTLLGYVGWRVARWLRRSRTLAVSVRGATMRMTVVDPGDQPAGLPSAPPGGELVVVALRVINDGSRPFRFSPGRFKLLDAQNRSFSADPAIGRTLEEALDRVVPPGAHEVLALAFVLPIGSRPRAGIYRSESGSIIVESVPWQA